MDNCDSIVVATGGRGAVMATWLDGWEMSPTARHGWPLVAYADGTWTEALARRFRDAGADVRDGGAFIRDWKLRNAANPAAYAPMNTPGYGAKTACILDAGRGAEWVLWFDQDTWVRGDAAPAVRGVADAARADPSVWFAAPKYRSLGPDSPFFGVWAAQHGMLMCRAADPRARLWLDATMAGENDERGFVTAFGGVEAAEAEVFDLYDPALYEGVVRDTEDGVRRVRESGAAVLHYSGGAAKRAFFEDVGTARAAWDGAAVDAVFPLGRGSAHGDLELRFALRSLEAHCPFVRNVWVVGERPEWLSGAARHIPWPDRFCRDPDANIIDKVLRACMEPGMAETMLVCSDDQFVTRDCTLADFAPMLARDGGAEWLAADAGCDPAWADGLRDTLAEAGPRARVFEPHAWSPVGRREFMRVCAGRDWRRERGCKIFTMYYNAAGEAGSPPALGRHAFTGADSDCMPPAAHVAYDDGAFSRPGFRAALAAMFPAPSRYER